MGDRPAGRHRFERRDPFPIKGKGLLEACLLMLEDEPEPGPGTEGTPKSQESVISLGREAHASIEADAMEER